MDPPRHLNSQGDSTRLMGEVEASHTPGGIRTPNPLIRSLLLKTLEVTFLTTCLFTTCQYLTFVKSVSFWRYII